MRGRVVQWIKRESYIPDLNNHVGMRGKVEKEKVHLIQSRRGEEGREEPGPVWKLTSDRAAPSPHAQGNIVAFYKEKQKFLRQVVGSMCFS